MDIDGLAASYMVEKLLDARLVRTPAQNAPVAGANLALKVPSGVFWEILSLRFTFTASATVANRRPALVILDTDGAEYMHFDTRRDIAAAGVGNYSFVSALGYEDTVEPGVYGLPIFPFPLGQGWTIGTVTSGIDATDQYSAVRIAVREFAADRIAEQVRRLENDVAGLFGRFDFETSE